MKTKYDNVFVNPSYEDIMFRTPIAFDLDSVLNEGQYLRDYVAKHFGVSLDDVKKVVEGHEVFHFEIPGVGYREMSKVINTCIMEESPSALHTPHMPDVLRYVHEITGVPIAVVTARIPMTVGVTKRWLEEHLDGTPFHAYIINGLPKIDALRPLGARIFIDDRFKTVKNLIGKIDWPVMFTRPWNVGRANPLPVSRVRDLRGIIPLLNIITGRDTMDWPEGLPYPNRKGE